MSKLKALVVDDSKVMRLMVMRGLRRSEHGPFVFEEAGNGEEALEKIKSDQFDVLFVDINMPIMSGIELVTRIRTEVENHDLRIAMISSEKTSEKMDEALKAGANAYICKPFTEKQFESKLAGLLGEARQEVANR